MLSVPTLLKMKDKGRMTCARQTNGFMRGNMFTRKVLVPEAESIKEDDNPLFKAVAGQNILGSLKKRKNLNAIKDNGSLKLKNIHSQSELIDKIIELKTQSYLLQETTQEETNNRIFYSKFYIYEFITALLGLFSVIDIEIYFDLTFNYEGNDKIKPYGYLLLFLNITSLLLWINCLLYAYDQFKLRLLNHLLPANTKFINTSYMKDFIILFGVTFVQPCQIFCGWKYSIGTSFREDVKLKRSINSILSIFVLTRIFYIDRFIIFQTSYMTPDNDEICRKHFFKAGTKYALISLLKTKPFHVYVMLVISFLYAFQFIIKVFESGVKESVPTYQLSDSFNIIYYCFITIFTTGYGDMSAKTGGGRVAVFIISILGSFMISLFLMSLTSIVEFSQIEKKSFNLIKQSSLLDDKINEAKNLTHYVTKIFLNNKKEIHNKKVDEKFKYQNFVDSVENKKAQTRDFFNLYKNFRNTHIDFDHQLSETNNYDFENIGFECQYFDREYQRMNDYDKTNIDVLKKLLNKLENVRRKIYINKGMRLRIASKKTDKATFKLSKKLLNGMI